MFVFREGNVNWDVAGEASVEETSFSSEDENLQGSLAGGTSKVAQ